ncbi:MAG: DNA topoisomerase (ATP-hydrolyzing) [Actinomycetota bacterium]|nr:DNA topoisomerase (ATP-hydrolyzing) [Actinomycetota bacterium]
MNKQQKLLPDETNFAKEVVGIPVEDEMQESFLAYSLSVITSRAIPDVKDGLKPVQRRILYAMLRMGLRPENPHRKSARVVGDTMGRYHPHGDAAIYDALVRMGQDFSRGMTLVDKQGNFGSLDDPPAAARYTECRLAETAMEMLREIDEDTVDFRPTYDGESDEPSCLPALLPNLLVNGTSGIAVGMATNMPTHNLVEAAAAISLIMKKRRPKPTIKEIMAVIPGPDFPSGGIIINDNLEEIYKTGKGTIRIRAKAHVEPSGKNRQAVVITELPYLVGPERIISKLKELNEASKLNGIMDFKNLSDRESGLKIQITVKPGHNPQAVLADLYKLTPLEETFSINNVVLVDGEPKTLGIYDLCDHYINHRLQIVVRRTKYRLTQAKARLNIVKGLLIALDSIDAVVSIIRKSEDTAEARSALMKKFKLTQIQTDHILDMPLKRLTALEKRKLEEEQAELKKAIAGFNALLKSDTRQKTLVIKELNEVVKEFGRERRTEIVSSDDLPVFETTEVAEDIEDEPCVVTLSSSGQIGRLGVDGAKKANPGRHDIITASVLTSTTSTVTAITSEGRALHILAAELVEADGRTRGGSASQLFGTNKGEAIHTILSKTKEHLVLVTETGVVKRLETEEVQKTQNAKTVIKLKPGDRVVSAFCSPSKTDFGISTSDGQFLRMPVSSVSIQGRGAAGIAGMKLKNGSAVVAAGTILGDDLLTTVLNNQTAKVTPLSEFESRGRNGVGVRVTKVPEDSKVTVAKIGSLTNLLAVMATDNDPKKADPNPVPFLLESSNRDLVSTKTDRQILFLGISRW